MRSQPCSPGRLGPASRCYPGSPARSAPTRCARSGPRTRRTKASQPRPRPAEDVSNVAPGQVAWLGILATSEPLGFPGLTVWPELAALGENRRGRPDLRLCYYRAVEFSQPHAPWRIPALSLGHISQATEEISKMLGTSCVPLSPRPPGTGGLLFAARGRKKLIKGRSWGRGEASSRHLCACFVLPQDNVPAS